MPQFDTSVYLAQIFWLFISFGFLYLMMSRLICPMIEEVLSERERCIQQTLNQAEVLTAAADDLNNRYQAYIQIAEKEKNEKIQAAYTRLQKKSITQENRQEALLRRRIRTMDQKIKATSTLLRQESDKLSGVLAAQLATQIERMGDDV
ncbi:MAG: hypothetical protein IJV07_02305 [Alphaproteobacteria bacterium]|nr:hypothetical protein [Alphaproteobacteria bacterium]